MNEDEKNTLQATVDHNTAESITIPKKAPPPPSGESTLEEAQGDDTSTETPSSSTSVKTGQDLIKGLFGSVDVRPTSVNYSLIYRKLHGKRADKLGE